MPLLSPKKKSIEKNIKINIDSNLLDEIQLYCDFAQLASVDEFFTEAAKFVLSKDKDWVKKNQSKK